MAGGKTVAAQLNAWVCFADEAGQNLRPPTGRTWGLRGHTPQVRVSGAGGGRVSIAAILATHPDRPTRLIFRSRRYRGRRGESKAFTEDDYMALLDAAHQQLGGPLVVVWDNLGRHVSARIRQLIGTRSWLRVFQLPPYAPELNPVEAVWAHLKRSLTNLIKQDLDQLHAAVKTRLRRMQYRPDLLTGFLKKPGLDLRPP